MAAWPAASAEGVPEPAGADMDRELEPSAARACVLGSSRKGLLIPVALAPPIRPYVVAWRFSVTG